ncbi:MAG: phosphoribosylamine--glycine ligase [Phycisphaerales bacterium]
MSDAPHPCNVLLLGTGGREHALAWKLRQSPRLGQLWVQADANAGLLALGRPCDAPMTARERFFLRSWLDKNEISLVVVGPEGPLAEGIVDELAAPGRRIFGPVKEGARLEFDKAFAKQIMKHASVPTADGRSFSSYETARAYIEARDIPLVVKASGLCAGKGVVVCGSRAEALAALDRIMKSREFGEAGTTVVIEERLVGQEMSVLALVDGRSVLVLDPCQDHKQVGEGDTGPNTGGMGSYCPTPLATETVMAEISREVLVPTIDALRRDGVEFRGVLYAGMMLTPGGPKVLEFNTRFGDPETQPLMARFEGDLVDTLWKAAGGELDQAEVRFDPRAACCVVVCSEGYPGSIRKGLEITGVEAAEACAGPGEQVIVFHAGTARGEGGTLVTAGGRVFGVTALAADLRRAQQLANEAAATIRFPGAFFRRDIGHRVLDPRPSADPGARGEAAIRSASAAS